MRVINGYTTITSHNESFKALTKLRNILSVWSQIQKDILSQALEIDEMKSAESENLSGSISNEDIIRDKETYIRKLKKCKRKTVPSIVKRLVSISKDPIPFGI